MIDSDQYHPSYDLLNAEQCYLCELPIPVGLFRGFIEKRCHPLALQIDHVLPKAKGGQDDPDNLKPTHAVCNKRKSKNDWSPRLRAESALIVESILVEELDPIWFSTPRSTICEQPECKRKRNSGVNHRYCHRHARLNGEVREVKLCKVPDCVKQRRSRSIFCQSHAIQHGVSFNKEICSVEFCTKQIQRAFSKDLCQTHARAVGLAPGPKFGIKHKAACVATHTQKASRFCFFCVEIDRRTEYVSVDEIKSIEVEATRFLARKLSECFSPSRSGAIHLKEIWLDSHISNDCDWCRTILNLQKAWLDI